MALWAVGVACRGSLTSSCSWGSWLRGSWRRPTRWRPPAPAAASCGWRWPSAPPPLPPPAAASTASCGSSACPPGAPETPVSQHPTAPVSTLTRPSEVTMYCTQHKHEFHVSHTVKLSQGKRSCIWGTWVPGYQGTWSLYMGYQGISVPGPWIWGIRVPDPCIWGIRVPGLCTAPCCVSRRPPSGRPPSVSSPYDEPVWRPPASPWKHRRIRLEPLHRYRIPVIRLEPLHRYRIPVMRLQPLPSL